MMSSRRNVVLSWTRIHAFINTHTHTHTHTTYEQTNFPSLTHANTYTHKFKYGAGSHHRHLEEKLKKRR
jgi:hypothetical protein